MWSHGFLEETQPCTERAGCPQSNSCTRQDIRVMPSKWSPVLGSSWHERVDLELSWDSSEDSHWLWKTLQRLEGPSEHKPRAKILLSTAQCACALLPVIESTFSSGNHPCFTLGLSSLSTIDPFPSSTGWAWVPGKANWSIPSFWLLWFILRTGT